MFCKPLVDVAVEIKLFFNSFVCFLFDLFICLPRLIFLPAYQLMWAWGAKACVVRISPEYPLTVLERMDSWVGWTVLWREKVRLWP